MDNKGGTVAKRGEIKVLRCKLPLPKGGGRDPVVKLGRSLYWDERLSANGKVAFAEFIRELPSHEKTLFLNQRLCLPALDNPKLLTFPPVNRSARRIKIRS